MSLYVPLDVDYASDDKLIEAGPLAELLYIRGLAFCKRTMSDGRIKRAQLTVVAHGIPSARKHVYQLVDVGLWRETSDGWAIVAWLKRNKSAAQIRSDSETKKAASALANHRRWHIGEGKEPSFSCPHCYPKPDPKPDPKPETVSEPPRNPQSRDRDRDRDRGKSESESEGSVGTQDDSLGGIVTTLAHRLRYRDDEAG
jgi:hypothetical protein